MAEMDYSAVLPTEPPDGLVEWVVSKGQLDKELLIYKASRYYEPLEDRTVPCVELVCTSCKTKAFAEKAANTCCNPQYATAPFGFQHPEIGEILGNGDHCLCPTCGSPVLVRHVGSLRGNWDCVEVYPMTISRYEDKLVLMGWCVRKWFEKDGNSGITVWPYDAYVVERRCIVRLTGYQKVMATISLRGKWEQRKRYCDAWGRSDFIYPWDKRLLEGSTAENSKLDLYLKANAKDGAYAVTYLRLWLRHPQVENLVMQGAGRLLDSLIKAERGYYNGGPAVPEIKEIRWKEKSPSKMLGMTKDQLRTCVKEKWCVDTLRFWCKERDKGRALAPEEVGLAASIGFYDCTRLERDVKLDYLKVARYVSRQRCKDKRCDMSILWDYWRFCKQVDQDLSLPAVRFPPRLMSAHDRTLEMVRWKEAAAKKAEREARIKLFEERYAALNVFSWERDGILIRPARDELELKREGEKLGHCVGGYAQSHASGRDSIFLVRRSSAPDKPWYTLDLDEKNLIVRQNRGKKNCARTAEVEAFEAAWLEHCRELRAVDQKKGRRRKTEVAARATA